MHCFISHSTKKTDTGQITSYKLWLNKNTDTHAISEEWYVNTVNSLTMHCEKQLFGQKGFYGMDPKGDNCSIKHFNLTFEMFSNYFNQLTPKQQRKDIKNEMISASMYDLNKSRLMYIFRMSDNFAHELQLSIGGLK